MKKPIGRTTHGILDYGFAALLFAAPFLLKLSPKAKKLALGLGASVAGYSAATDYPVGVKGLLSFKQHRTVDIGNLAGMATLPLVMGLAKEKKAAGLFGALLAIGIVNVLLTDWED